ERPHALGLCGSLPPLHRAHTALRWSTRRARGRRLFDRARTREAPRRACGPRRDETPDGRSGLEATRDRRAPRRPRWHRRRVARRMGESDTLRTWVRREIASFLNRKVSPPPLVLWCDPARVWREILEATAADGDFELWAEEEHELVLRER